MALVSEIINKLRLDYLDHGWVKAIHETEFLEFCDLPIEYENAIESLDLSSIFLDIIDSTDLWLHSEAIPNEEKSWATLSHLVQQEKVIAILAYFIDYGYKNVLTKEHRTSAFLASRVYFKLLTIPGYKAYDIYHSQLFAQSLACFSFPIKICDEASNFNSKQLSNEVNMVLKELEIYVKELKSVLPHLGLSPNDMNFEEILSNILYLTGCEIIVKLCVDKILLNKIIIVTHGIIEILILNNKMEPNKEVLLLLFKCILPKLLIASSDTRNLNKCVSPFYVSYLIMLLVNHRRAALLGYRILLQQVCYGQCGLERTEVREMRSKLVIGLMTVLPRSAYKEFIKWVIDLSVATRVPHRQLAVEILAKLLENEHEEVVSEIVAITDNVAPVADCSHEPEPQPGINQMINQQPNVVEQPEVGVPEEDVGWNPLCARHYNVMHADILRAVYDRTNDESGALRTRALAILTKCLSSKHLPLIQAIQNLNGEAEVSRLMAVAARSANDERAAVRKAATALILQLLTDPAAPPPQAQQLAFLVSLCRDASIIVRTSAIAALGDLVMVRPSEDVLNGFLDGPLHQVSDPETKVQEQVLSLIDKVLTYPLRKFTTPGSDDPMPWTFLAGIVLRKKKKHLQKVCLMLSKTSKSINHRLVDILSTHLGALSDERDLQCLTFLTSVARYVDYSDVSFVLDYYYKLADNYQIRDSRLLKLTVELLVLWCRYINTTERTHLRDHLVQRLAASRDNGCRIKCAVLASQLDPDNLTWATEIMQLSERRALAEGDVLEALRAADLSLVAPVPPKPELLRIFLAVADAPPDWDEARCAMCVAGAARLCIRSRDAAAVAAPVFADLLARVTEPLAVRVNSLVGLSDICARYTCIIEPLLGTMSDCFSEDSPMMLRRLATRELTRLLLGGFLRLRTPLYYRYCALLADRDVDVREPVEYYVTCGLTNDTIYHHFVECVLHYNHDGKNSMNFESRQLIYDVMLQRMSLVQKLNIQCRLAREILEYAADLTDEGDEELSQEMTAAVLDTIHLICGSRMKLPRKQQKSGDANDIDDLQERVTTNIVSHKMKIQVAEVLVPAVLRLYARLSPGGGQINTYLVRLATDLLKDYEQEIKELFEDNEELMKSVQRFQETIGVQPTFCNVRNLVTSTASPEPPTPRAPRPPRTPRRAPPERRRALRM